MTRQKSFKRLVRTRMDKTGESYTAARASLLANVVEPASAKPWLATSDTAIRERTGRGWETWFDALDAWGAEARTHREIARWVAAELEIDPLAWNAQAIAMSYERTRGLRQPGEHADGFAVSASKTIGVPAEALFAAIAEPARRARWLPEADLRERTATPPRSARYDWGDGGSRVHVTVAAKDAGRSTVSVQHARLAGAAEADRMKALWRERLATLKATLEA